MFFVQFEVSLSFSFEIFCLKLGPTHNRFPQGFCNVWSMITKRSIQLGYNAFFKTSVFLDNALGIVFIKDL